LVQLEFKGGAENLVGEQRNVDAVEAAKERIFDFTIRLTLLGEAEQKACIEAASEQLSADVALVFGPNKEPQEYQGGTGPFEYSKMCQARMVEGVAKLNSQFRQE
jgi:hypothetical protein